MICNIFGLGQLLAEISSIFTHQAAIVTALSSTERCASLSSKGHDAQLSVKFKGTVSPVCKSLYLVLLDMPLKALLPRTVFDFFR